MNLLEFVEKHPSTISALGVFLPLLFPQVRTWLRGILRKLGARKRKFEAKLDQILDEVYQVKSEVSEIKTEVQFSNDTSTKQEVALLKKRSQIQFWRQNKPSIEMDGDAQVLHVSETLCRLMGVWTPGDLYMRNWLLCVEASRVDDFLSAFSSTVKFKSDFDFVFAVQTKSGDDQGVWKLMISDVTPPGYSKPIYSGFFKPMDDRAKEVAADLHWSK